MLTEKQFEAIGRLALAFNDLEWMISYHLQAFISCREETVSALLASEYKTFDSKAGIFIRILRTQIKQYDDPDLERTLETLAGLVNKAKDIAQKRNENVHAIGGIEAETSKEILINMRQRKYRYADEAKILGATEEAKTLAMELNQLGLSAIYQLDQIRKR